MDRILLQLEHVNALDAQRSAHDQAEQTRIRLELQQTFAAAEERRATEHADQMAQPRRETRFDLRGNLLRQSPQPKTNHGEELAAHYRLDQQERPVSQWTPGARTSSVPAHTMQTPRSAGRLPLGIGIRPGSQGVHEILPCPANKHGWHYHPEDPKTSNVFRWRRTAHIGAVSFI